MTGEVETPIDVLAIGCHPDDVELTCGGALLRASDQGYRTAILDLTRGEMGSKGSRDTRAEEAARAAEILGVVARENAALPDAGIFNTQESRERVVELLRHFQPRVVILPYFRGRHPDHRVGSELARDACFLAGLKNFGRGPARRPDKVIYAASFREHAGKPTFVVDISAQFERKMAAIRCYGSQFDDVFKAGEAFPTGQPFYDLVESQNRHYGSLIRRGYGEPFVTEETVEVEDLVTLGVSSF